MLFYRIKQIPLYLYIYDHMMLQINKLALYKKETQTFDISKIISKFHHFLLLLLFCLIKIVNL